VTPDPAKPATKRKTTGRLAKVRIRATISPGALVRLEEIAETEGTDLSGAIEISARSAGRSARKGKPAPLPFVAPEPEEEPDPVGERFKALVERRPSPEMSDRTVRIPLQVPGLPPELRNPKDLDAPETIRHLAHLVGHGITAAGKAALRAWMLGDDDALWLLGAPAGAGVPAASLADSLGRPGSPVQGHVPLAFGDVPASPVAVVAPPPLPVIIAEDQIPAMRAALQRVVDEATAAQAPAQPPAPVAPPTPLAPLRDYSAPDAPEWVRGIVGALADGLDALVSEEAMESLRAWRRGEDVVEPDLPGLRDKE
jgi:hypothetical protein